MEISIIVVLVLLVGVVTVWTLVYGLAAILMQVKDFVSYLHNKKKFKQWKKYGGKMTIAEQIKYLQEYEAFTGKDQYEKFKDTLDKNIERFVTTQVEVEVEEITEVKPEKK